MKKIKLITLFLFFVFSFSPSFAFKYCNNDKTLFYDAFIDGYLTEMQKNVDKLDINAEKKTQFMYLIKKSLDKDYLIKSSWDCIQTYPIQQIVSASVICTMDWQNKQSQSNSDLFELLKN
ncbi:hypothetical protein II906_07225 [bacterium]|nr:hypothetical protein [bacterium]